jgi:hypothetical protein
MKWKQSGSLQRALQGHLPMGTAPCRGMPLVTHLEGKPAAVIMM